MKKLTETLKGKLILSYLGVAFITVLVVSVLIRATFSQSLMILVMDQQTAQLSADVQTYYSAHGSLEGFAEAYRFEGMGEIGNHPGMGMHGSGMELRGVRALVDAHSTALLPSLGYNVGEEVPQKEMETALPVTMNGEVIARILPDTSRSFSLSAAEQVFLNRSTVVIVLAALAGIAAAVGMGFLLAGGLLRPIRRLTGASQALQRGELGQQVEVSSRDELGQLSATFNRMSADLLKADQQRKRMSADITHDLSTPIQIISGYVEMLENDPAVLTPQRIEIIKTELEHLRRLVSDLTMLTQIEGGGLEVHAQALQPGALLARVHAAYEPIAARQGVRLALETEAHCAPIRADEGRLQQVLKNLMDNALRYTPKGGTITLRAQQDGEGVSLQVADTGAGIEAEDLPLVFERFYRADPARGVNSGKMGLGLAICKALVNAQGGTIGASSAGRGQGTTMTITFPPAGG